MRRPRAPPPRSQQGALNLNFLVTFHAIDNNFKIVTAMTEHIHTTQTHTHRNVWDEVTAEGEQAQV